MRNHPCIGIARVGNPKEDRGRFYGPENPGRIDPPRVLSSDKYADDVPQHAQHSSPPLIEPACIAHQKAAWCALQGR